MAADILSYFTILFVGCPVVLLHERAKRRRGGR